MKLTLDSLKERADAVASEELLATISGGTENACHDEEPASDGDSGGWFDGLGAWIEEQIDHIILK